MSPKNILASHFNLKEWSDGEEYHRLKGLTYIDYQLSEAIDFLKLAQNTQLYEPQGSLKEVQLNQALLRAFITSYAKCFNSTKAKGKFPLTPKDVFKGKPSLIKNHLDLMELRNEFVAHNGDNGLQVVHFFVSDSDDQLLVRTGIESYRNEVNFDVCLDLVVTAKEQVKSKIIKEIDHLSSKAGKPVKYK